LTESTWIEPAAPWSGGWNAWATKWP